MRKIVIATGVFEPDIGGPASYAKLVGSEAARLARVEVITYSSVRRFDDDKHLPFRVTRVWKKWPWFLRHIIYFTKLFLKSKNTNILYALNTLNAGISCYIASKIFKNKFYLRIVGDYAWQVAQEKGKTVLGIDEFQKREKRGKIKLLYIFQSWICKKADKIIVPSEYLKNLVLGWGIPEEKIVIIYNGVDFKPVRMEKEKARKELGISGNIILSVGRLAPWKGFRMLIKIMPEILKINQFARLVIVGNGPDRKCLESMINNLRLDKKVYLVGAKSRDELAVCLAAADMFVLNTGYEGFSHQILEVMFAETPIITTDIGGNKEIIVHGENGFLIDYNDEGVLVDTIKMVWDKPELRKRFIINGRKTVRRFGYEKMIKETLGLLVSHV